MTFAHYSATTLSDVRHALIRAYDAATGARFYEEDYHGNIKELITSLDSIANDLGFDLVKRKADAGDQVLRFPDSVSLED